MKMISNMTMNSNMKTISNIKAALKIENTSNMKTTSNKLGLSWGSTRLRQLAWSYPTKLNIVFITVLNIGLNIELHIWLNIGFNIGFNIGVQYWVWYWGSILSKPQPQPNLNTTVGFDTKMTLHTPPHPPTHRNFSGTSRRARELKFGTDTH